MTQICWPNFLSHLRATHLRTTCLRATLPWTMAVAATLIVSPSRADEVSDAYAARLLMSACVEGKAKPAERVKACSELIRGNRQAPAETALVFLNRAAAYKAMGDESHAAEDYAEALRRYNGLINPDQAAGQVIYQRAVALQALGEVDRALALLDEAIRLEPLNSGALIERGSIMARYKGELARAITDFDKVLAHAPNNVDALLGRGDALGRIGQFGRSFADLDRAIALAPDNARAHVLRGLANARRGDSQRAATDYDNALALDPRNTDALVNRAALFSLAGQQDRAIADLDAAIAIQPNLPLAFFNRGFARFALRQYEFAINDYGAAIGLDGRMATAYSNRCMARILAGQDTALAQVDCDRAFALTPDSIDVRSSRGFFYLKTGKPALARDEYDAALKRDPNNALALYGRGLARIKLNDIKGGEADRSAAAVLDDDIELQFRNYGIQ